jgi:hypothetical protein
MYGLMPSCVSLNGSAKCEFRLIKEEKLQLGDNHASFCNIFIFYWAVLMKDWILKQWMKH